MIAVTRAIGDHNMKRIGYVRNDIHFTMIELTPTDDYLILACDGVRFSSSFFQGLDLVSKLLFILSPFQSFSFFNSTGMGCY